MLRKHVIPLLLASVVILPLPLLALVVHPDYRYCMQYAVSDREQALVWMQQQYHKDIEVAMEQRSQAIIDAWHMEDESAIRNAESQAQQRFSQQKSDADRMKSEAETQIRNLYREAEKRCQDEKRQREEEERRIQEEERKRVEEERRRQQEEQRQMEQEMRRQQEEERRRQQEEERLRREQERQMSSSAAFGGGQCALNMACHFSTPSCAAPSRIVDCNSSECRNAGTHQGHPLCTPINGAGYNPPITQQPPTGGQKCISDSQCGGGHCSMRYGCLRYCDDPNAICPAVCAGICEGGQNPGYQPVAGGYNSSPGYYQPASNYYQPYSSPSSYNQPSYNSYTQPSSNSYMQPSYNSYTPTYNSQPYSYGY